MGWKSEFVAENASLIVIVHTSDSPRLKMGYKSGDKFQIIIFKKNFYKCNPSTPKAKLSPSSLSNRTVQVRTHPTQHTSVHLTLCLEFKYNVQEEAVKVFRSIKSEVAVVSIAGLYRCGKSYLLNHFIGQPGGFSVGHKINAATQGLWIWDKPIPVEK